MSNFKSNLKEIFYEIEEMMLIDKGTLLVLHHKGGMKVIKREEHEEKEFQKVIIYDPSIKKFHIFLKKYISQYYKSNDFSRKYTK